MKSAATTSGSSFSGHDEEASRAPSLAPLRFEGRAQYDASPQDLFDMVSDPQKLHRWLPLIRRVRMDHAHSERSDVCAIGSVRHCDFRGMGKVREGIFWWNPPHGYGFRFEPQGRARLMTPTADHAIYFLVAPDGGTGGIFTIRVHFNWRGVLMRRVAVHMMPMMLNMALSNLQRELGGRGGTMRRVR